MSFNCQLSSTSVPKILYENRYCNQEGFSILALGGKDKNNKRLNRVLEIKILSFEITEFQSMELPHDRLKTAVINSDIVAIVDSEGTFKKPQKNLHLLKLILKKVTNGIISILKLNQNQITVFVRLWESCM